MKVSITFGDLDAADAAAIMARVTSAAPPFAAPPGTQQPAPAPAPQTAALPGPGPAPAPAPQAAAGAVTAQMVKDQMSVWVRTHKASGAKAILEEVAAGQHEARVDAFPADKLPILLQRFQAA